jgi:hypothetical protein
LPWDIKEKLFYNNHSTRQKLGNFFVLSSQCSVNTNIKQTDKINEIILPFCNLKLINVERWPLGLGCCVKILSIEFLPNQAKNGLRTPVFFIAIVTWSYVTGLNRSNNSTKKSQILLEDSESQNGYLSALVFYLKHGKESSNFYRIVSSALLDTYC